MKSSFSRFKTKYRLAGFESLEPRRVLATEGEWVTIERTLDTSALSGNISGTISWNDGTQSAAQVISQPSSGALRIRFDYSLDSSGFFADQSRRQLLQLAADIVTTKFSDTLAAIAPSGVNQWNASFQNPSTGQMTSVANLTIAANELVVYVGARNLSGNTLGLASTGGYSAGGTQAFLDLVKARGQTGALASTPTDYGPWGGSIAFRSNTSWHFGASTIGLDSTENDFLSTAIHEICHILGFGTAPSWATYLSGTQFVGGNAKAKYDLGGNVPTDSIRVHWAEGTTDSGKETLMDPTLSAGTRKNLTRLDLAGLQDIGWSLIEPSATIRGSRIFADNRSYDVDVQMVGARAGTGGWSETLQIGNAPPTLAPIGNYNIVVGTPLVISRLGTFSDLGFDNPQASPPSQERFTFRIEWGDGSPPQTGSASIESMGSPGNATTGFFDGSHIFNNLGTFSAVARVSDDDGGSATRTFTVTVQAAPQLSLSLSKSSVDENAGTKAAVLSVRRTGVSLNPLTVQLTSSDTSELRLPPTITIPAGASELLVDLEAVDDSLLDGTISVTLTASASGFSSANVPIEVTDYETISGLVNQNIVNENAGTGVLTWTISRSNTDRSQPLIVQLSSSDTSELVVPATVTIPAGAADAVVPVTVEDDAILDGTIVVQLLASATGYRSDANSVSVLDIESLQLVVDNFRLAEKSPADFARATVSLSFPAPTGGYVVQLTPSLPEQLALPVSITIPAGSQSFQFNLEAIDDYAVEGLLSLSLSASATGVSAASIDLVIEDNDLPLWQNPFDPLDSDNNTFFNAMDALVVINNLNRFGTRYLRPGIDLPSPPYVDTTGDGLINAMDALIVINALQRRV
jgi:hypothetical protein